MTAGFQTDKLERLTRDAVCAALRTRRLKLGMSQSQVARMLGCHTVGISQLENGHRNVSLRTLVRVGIALGCTIKVTLDPVPAKRKRKRRKGRAA